jgi:HPt (histidine-containing phosphotransfer) domain-containing protein
MNIDVPVLDIERALRSWRDAERYKTFLRKFLQDYGSCVDQLRVSDIDAARALLHKLVGAAGSLGLDDISAVARQLHQSLAQELIPKSDFMALQHAFERAQAPILGIVGEAPVAAAGLPAKPDVALLARLIQQLLQALEQDTPLAAEPALQALADLLPAGDVLPLQRALLGFDFSLCKREALALDGRINLQRGT